MALAKLFCQAMALLFFQEEKSIKKKNNERILTEPLMALRTISIRPLIIGDPAYSLSEWLMKPYPLANISPRQKTFNRNLSRARVVVEQAFGKLKGRIM